MSITDPFNTANTQNCTFSYDDLGRIASVNCGAVWSQTFSYDAFGNINKSGSMSFQPTYSPTTNRMTSLPGFTPTYDANGNVLNDNSHIYAWDAEGRPATIDGVGLTYDALLRMVEQNRSGVYTEIVYAPTGEKLALMNGQTLQKAFVPQPGNGTAVYNASGLSYYRHPDWLGSSRFASTPTRTMYSSTAYAPFGEPYAQAGTTDLSFTGQNQDTVGGLYDFFYREYSTQGRWPSPDPAGLAAVDLSDPQSLNRYAYVLNNPLNLIDPLGLQSRTEGPSQLSCSLYGFWWSGEMCLLLARQILGEGNRDLWLQDKADQEAKPKPQPQTQAPNKVPCTNVPKNPPGESATANLNLVNQSTQGMWPATKLAYFNMVFRTGGAFDYKTNYRGSGWGPDKNQFVDYGNWNFGYSCGANYSSLFCQSAAGANRMWLAAMAGQNPFGNGIPFVKAPYGDQKADNQQIRNGIQAQASGCVQ